MKKIIIVALMLLGEAFVAGAQTTKESVKDTVLITSSNIKFSKETYETEKGKSKTDYLVLVDGEWYYTNKSSYNKYLSIERLGGTLNAYFVKPKDSKVKSTPKVIVL